MLTNETTCALARTKASRQAGRHARKHARTHARTHTHTHTPFQITRLTDPYIQNLHKPANRRTPLHSNSGSGQSGTTRCRLPRLDRAYRFHCLEPVTSDNRTSRTGTARCQGSRSVAPVSRARRDHSGTVICGCTQTGIAPEGREPSP